LSYEQEGVRTKFKAMLDLKDRVATVQISALFQCGELVGGNAPTNVI
jgi:hypothetical protein